MAMSETDFFAWLRSQQENKRLSQSMVDGAHEMLALMETDALKSALIKVNSWSDNAAIAADGSGMKFSANGMALLKQFEGFSSKPYKDSVGKWTIGYGNTYYENRKSVTGNDAAISAKRAEDLKTNIINMDFAPAVNLMLADQIEKKQITQNMFDALVSLAYNIGTRGLAGSSVIKHLKAGRVQAAADAFLAWNKGTINGQRKVLKGLQNRRTKERALFLKK